MQGSRVIGLESLHFIHVLDHGARFLFVKNSLIHELFATWLDVGKHIYMIIKINYSAISLRSQITYLFFTHKTIYLFIHAHLKI